MPTEHSDFRDNLITILGGFDALSDMLTRFIEAHQAEPWASDFIAALVNAMQASDRAAALVRERLRGGTDRGA